MFNKEDNAETEVGAILKKMLIGGIFVVVFIVIFPPIVGVDLVNLCVMAEEGQEAEDNGCKAQAENKVSDGWNDMKPYIVIGVDIFVVIFVLAILFGPGIQLARWQFTKNASR